MMHSSGSAPSGAARHGTRSAHAFQPEIQGLRAVSVLCVIWAHAGLPGLAGGFTGVDVFFVISGFLITRLLLAEAEATGRVDLLAFWARRTRRLLPNALAALAGTVALAVFLFPGYDFLLLRRDITAAALEFANFRFASRGIDYFAQEQPASPVLHFWSLSVEEQFYLVWPVLLLGLWLAFPARRRLAVLWLLALVWCASFIACVLLTERLQPVAYFNTGTRCWQLVTGALLAVGWGRIERLPDGARAAIAWTGAGAVIAAMLLVDGAAYPGVWALLPTLGAAGLLAGFPAAAPAGLLRRTLAAAPMQWIGARSYSWYLWHWPLMALPRLSYPDVPYIEAIAIPVSLAVAAAAYAVIERPMRDGSLVKAAGPMPTFAGAAVGMALIVGCGYMAVRGLALVNPELAARTMTLDAAALDSPRVRRNDCHRGNGETDQPLCAYGDSAATRRAVLLGDSHAAHWFTPLEIAALEGGWQLLSWTKSACGSADIAPPYRVRADDCGAWRDHVLSRLTGAERPNLVILVNAEFHSRRVVDAERRELAPEASIPAWKAGLTRTIERLLAAGVEVAVIRDTPVLRSDFRPCLLKGGDPCMTPRAHAVRANAPDADVARTFGGRVMLTDLTDVICDPEGCPAMRDGLVVYRDGSHLTATYAATLAPHMRRLLDEAAARGSRPAPSGEAHALETRARGEAVGVR